MEKIYVKDDESILVGNSFIYDVSLYIYHKNYFSLAEKKYFQSDKEIKNIVKSHRINQVYEMCCELAYAPEYWLIKKGFTIWEKPIKKKRIKKIKNEK